MHDSVSSLTNTTQVAPLRLSRSRSTSVASLSGLEAGASRQLRRRGSSIQPSSVGEGSSSRKRQLSPLEEGNAPSKRARTSESNNTQAMETIQEETTTPDELGRDVTREENREGLENLVSYGPFCYPQISCERHPLQQGESSRNDASSPKEGGHATPRPRPLVREYQRSSRQSRQVFFNAMHRDGL